MTTTVVDMVTYSDADFTLSQQSPIRVGSNPLHMHVRSAADDETVWIEATSGNGMLSVSVGGSYDTISLIIPQAKLLNLPPGNYVHSLIMETVLGGLRTEVWRGTLTHSAGPTRWTS